ncbi:hypothetical protein BVG16_21685 [Paenibacillus selenitireducens]|uniref:VCBS repeat-containing protein n=1 Tax=Paenibacillus selenitireducens TaxID=1324314 RepID=A0A1T2X5R6_9BACL|nr:hypothetical protein [Paenibacillus selenitireducens]OPA75217.1 hypothetical protein BVG16_21685 [Paenibacillus selenitireducens]
MLNKLNRIGIMLTMLLLLGGCGIPTTPMDMIKPPVSEGSLQRDQISHELIKLLPNEAQLVAPLQGKEGQHISFGDMDGDGIDEAVVVYEENNVSGKILKAALFKQHQEEWRIISEVKGFGYGLEYAGFPDINHDGRNELALAWSLGEAGNGLDVYGLTDDKLELISKKEYHGKIDLE